jgi:hypothetical protein
MSAYTYRFEPKGTLEDRATERNPNLAGAIESMASIARRLRPTSQVWRRNTVRATVRWSRSIPGSIRFWIANALIKPAALQKSVTDITV